MNRVAAGLFGILSVFFSAGVFAHVGNHAELGMQDKFFHFISEPTHVVLLSVVFAITVIIFVFTGIKRINRASPDR